MWLIEYDTGKFINAERIVGIEMSSNGVVWFWSEVEDSGYRVAPEFTELFLNNIQALNNNIQNIESRYYKLKSDKESEDERHG